MKNFISFKKNRGGNPSYYKHRSFMPAPSICSISNCIRLCIYEYCSKHIELIRANKNEKKRYWESRIKYKPVNTCNWRECIRTTYQERCLKHREIELRIAESQERSDLIRERTIQLRQLSVKDLWLQIAKPIYDKVISD